MKFHLFALCLVSFYFAITAGPFAPSSAFAKGTCAHYANGTQVGTVEDSLLDKASGFAASCINPGIFWSINDSGNPPNLFAVNLAGDILDMFDVTGALNVDWEDVAVGPCPEEACSCVFIADIGDNLHVRANPTIYRFKEPVLGTTYGETAPADEMTFSYPDGRHDAETLLVDPRTGDIYIVTKEASGQSAVYRFPEPNPSSYPVTLEKVTNLTMTGSTSGSLLATGGAVASDGGRVVVRSLEHAQEYTIPEGEPLSRGFESAPQIIPLPSASQGEAITYATDGMALIVVSENIPAPIHEVSCDTGTVIEAPSEALCAVCEPESSGCGESKRGNGAPIPGSGTATSLVLICGGLFWRRARRSVLASRQTDTPQSSATDAHPSMTHGRSCPKKT